MDHKKERDEKDTPERSPLWYKLRRAERLRGGWRQGLGSWVPAAVLAIIGAALVALFVWLNRT